MEKPRQNRQKSKENRSGLIFAIQCMKNQNSNHVSFKSISSGFVIELANNGFDPDQFCIKSFPVLFFITQA